MVHTSIRCLAGWAAGFLLAAPAAALAAPATPDPGFGAGGTVRTSLPDGPASAAGMILDAAGRPVVVGKTGPMRVGLLRRTPTGAPDPGFAPAGRSLGVAGESRLTELVQHGDGYVAGGWIEPTPGARDFALVRWTGTGAPDAAFGIVSDPLSGGDGEIAALAVDAQQRIVAAGRAGSHIAVARYGAGGAPDAAFSHMHDLTGITDEEASGVVVEPAGRVLVAGTGTVPAGDRRFLLAALTPAGTIDGTFGAGGAVTLDVGDGTPAVRAMARAPDGRLLVGGTTDAGGAGGGLLARFLADGTPDPAFSGDGIARVGLAGAIVEGIAPQPDGKVVAVGTAGGDSFIARFRADGARDPGFGPGGVVRQSLDPAGDEQLTGVGIRADGRIVAGGRAGGAIVLSALTGGDSSDPALAMTADGLGDLVTFTVSATNRGADPARDVRIDVTPPPRLAARALATRSGACGGTSCLLGTIPAGGTGRVTLLARAAAPGPLAASARVTTSTFDADPGNDAASAMGTARPNRVVRRDRTNPVLKVRLPARRLAQVRRRVRVRVTTSEAVSVRLKVRTGSGRSLVRPRRVTLPRRGTYRTTLALTTAGRRAVAPPVRTRKRSGPGGERRARGPARLRVVVAARATDRAGNTATLTLRRTLRR